MSGSIWTRSLLLCLSIVATFERKCNIILNHLHVYIDIPTGILVWFVKYSQLSENVGAAVLTNKYVSGYQKW